MTRGGFTLIELLVVLVIIGLIYSLAATLMRDRPADGIQTVRFAPQSLDRALRDVDHSGYLRLVCTGMRCESCVLEDERGGALSDPFSVFESMPVRYDLLSTGSPLAKRGGDGPCFVMERFANGAVSETLFEYNNRFYHYSPLLHEVAILSSLDRAWERVDGYRHLPTDRTRYFHEEE